MNNVSVMKRLKRLTLRGLRGLGIFALVRDSEWRRRRLLILCYHGTSLDDEHQWSPTLYVPASQLRERFELLVRGKYNVLPLADAARRLADGTLPPRAVSITFDDGMHDFYVRALPVIEEFKLPVTLYLATYYCRNQKPVFDPICSYILWKGRGRELDVTGVLPEGGRFDLSSETSRRVLSERLFVHAREARLDAAAKDVLARKVAGRVGVDYDAIVRERLIHVMSPDEVQRLPPDLVDVQLHTHRHRTPRVEGLFKREIDDNRREIEALLPNAPEPAHFCYPSGFHRPEFLPWLRTEGVLTATTCEPGLATRNGDPLTLPRFIDTCHVDDAEFEGWMTGISGWLPRRRELLSVAHQVALREEAGPSPAPEHLASIGVVVPCYNGAEFIVRAVESIRAQTVPVSRIVVVDDGSKDDSAAIARSLGVECIETGANAGPSAARNRGLKALDTEWVAFLDADDFWRPNHLETLVPLMTRGVAVAFSDVVRTDGEFAPHRAGLPVGGALELLPTLLQESPVPQSGVLVRRGAITEAGGYDESFRLAEDFELWLRIAVTHRFAFSGRPTCVRQVHGGQASRDRAAMIRAAWRARRRLWESLATRTTPAKGITLNAAAEAITSAWEHTLRGAMYMRDRTLARELLSYRHELPVSTRSSVEWWVRVEPLWQTRRAGAALWRLMQSRRRRDARADLEPRA